MNNPKTIKAMKTIESLNVIPILGLAGLLTLMTGCASTPKVTDAKVSAVFQQPIDKVQKVSVDALTVTGFDIKKQEPTYVEGYRPHKIGFFVGSGGETVGLWLAALAPDKTEVKVTTSKSVVGIAGQKNWDDAVMAELTKTLGK